MTLKAIYVRTTDTIAAADFTQTVHAAIYTVPGGKTVLLRSIHLLAAAQTGNRSLQIAPYVLPSGGVDVAPQTGGDFWFADCVGGATIVPLNNQYNTSGIVYPIGSSTSNTTAPFTASIGSELTYTAGYMVILNAGDAIKYKTQSSSGTIGPGTAYFNWWLSIDEF